MTAVVVKLILKQFDDFGVIRLQSRKCTDHDRTLLGSDRFVKHFLKFFFHAIVFERYKSIRGSFQNFFAMTGDGQRIEQIVGAVFSINFH